jgi:hypothetical protein
VDDYFKDWLTVIDGMNNENTYKLAWGRAIIELCHTFDVQESNTVFTFEQIGEYVLKYFWNQTYFFNLYQGPAKSKPRIQQITEQVIKYYQSQSNSKIPDWFDKAKVILIKDKTKYNRFLRDISTALKQDVCWRFTKVGDINVDLYILDKDRRIIELTTYQHSVLKSSYLILSKLLSFRWVALLEKFNLNNSGVFKLEGKSRMDNLENFERFRRNLMAKYKVYIDRGIKSDEIFKLLEIDKDLFAQPQNGYDREIWNHMCESMLSDLNIKGHNLDNAHIIQDLESQMNEILIDYILNS